MPTILRRSAYLYRWMLALYPADFRARFGREMAYVFEQQAGAAWQEEGAAGVAAVWWRVVGEIVCGPILDRMSIPAASVLSSFGLFLLFAWVSGIAKHCK